MTAGRVVLWRHARTAHNAQGIWQGQLDIALDDVGRVEAKAAAAALMATEFPDGAPAAIVSSDLSRATETAAALAELSGLPVTTDPRLREIHAGRWQGMTRPQIVAAGMGDDLAAWQRGEDVRLGGGERRSEVGRRGAEAVREHAAAMEGGTLVVVAHGGLLRGTILTLLGLDPSRWQLLGRLGNCEWARLEPDEPDWRLLAYALPD